MADTDTPSGLIFLYIASKLFISISVLTRKAGTVNVATILLLTAFCIPEKATKPSGKSTTSSLEEGTFFRFSGCFSPVAIFTSLATTRPNSPVPTRVARSILAFLAAARAMGVAAMTPAAGVHDDFAGAAIVDLAARGAASELAFSTSDAVILPSRPVPATELISIPSSWAFFLARGEATTRAPGVRATELEACADDTLGAAAAATGAIAGGVSPDNDAA
mmetsp:Transcript_467/g.522  ORF Transcript_467/g.522 Transcript_467/m.522 type:complete len:220 (+) Transcript_467:568-1227(+)